MVCIQQGFQSRAEKKSGRTEAEGKREGEEREMKDQWISVRDEREGGRDRGE